MSTTLQKAVADVAEVMKFENWLRFYFVVEEEGAQENEALRIQIPEEQLAYLKKTQEHLYPLAEKYDGELIDYHKSCNDTCAHVAHLYDGTKYPSGMVAEVWDSKDLKVEMYLFGLWMQGHESVLDEEFMEFVQWIEGYESWKGTDEVKDYLSRLTDVGQKGCACKGSQAMH
ncbi:hypothetical protein [Desulfocurvus sp. DL9XJH121]